MQGQAPMYIFPDLFKLAWRKNKSVKEEVHNQNWVRGLWRMQTVEEMANFVKLWDLVQEVQLNNEPDSITWKWTSDGNYTAKSAYNVQFLGSYSHFNGESIWKAESEGKHKFFAWLMVQCKLLTADKLLARHWPCNPICSLCNQEHEIAAHLILHCPFCTVGVGENGNLDTTAHTTTTRWPRDYCLVANGTCPITKEDQKTQSCFNDVLCLEYLERA